MVGLYELVEIETNFLEKGDQQEQNETKHQHSHKPGTRSGRKAKKICKPSETSQLVKFDWSVFYGEKEAESINGLCSALARQCRKKYIHDTYGSNWPKLNTKRVH